MYLLTAPRPLWDTPATSAAKGISMSDATKDVDFDVVIIGGGPAGSTVASLLGQNGYRALLLEKDIHPRDHVGESITPSTNPIFKKIGFLEKIEDAGFVHKPGACWTAPRSPIGKFVSLRLGEFEIPSRTPRFTVGPGPRSSIHPQLRAHAAAAGDAYPRNSER